MTQSNKRQGPTIIEVVLIVVIACILFALIALTVNGGQTKNRNGDRQGDIDTLRTHLESYYASVDTYPTLANINDPDWRTKNMPKVQAELLNDPRWSGEAACSNAKGTTLAAEPTANCYSYQVIGRDGSPCNNDKIICAHYTLTATLEGGERYVKSSIN